MSDIGPASIAIGQAVMSFTNFLPKLSELRKASTADQSYVADVRIGEIGAVTIAMGVGIISSSLTKSSVPVVATAVMCLILLCLYESVLQAERPLEPKPRSREV